MRRFPRPAPAAAPAAPPPPARSAADVRVRAALLMFCCAAMVGVYALLPGTHSAFHSWTSSLLTLVLLWGYLLHRNRGRLPLRSDTLMLAGFTLLFLLPPLYLSLREGSRFVDIYEVSALQPRVSLLTGVGAFLMLVAFHAVFRRLGGTSHPVPPPLRRPLASSRVLPGMAAIALVIVSARLFLLASGAYYWSYGEESFVTGRWYSLTLLLSRYGLLVPVLLWLLAGQDRRWKMWAWAATAAELAWTLPSGSRQALLETVLGFLLVAWWRSGTLPRGRMVTVLVIASLAMPVMYEYRYTISRYAGTQEVSLDATVRALWEAQGRVGVEGTLVLTDRFIDRLYDGQFFGYLMKHYREVYDWEYGDSYAERIPHLVLPYFLVGGERTAIPVHLDRWFKLLYRGTNPSTLFGEGFANFGYLGIPLVGLFLGAVLALYEAAYRRLRDSVFVDAVYLVHASMTPFMVSVSGANLLGFLRNALLMILAMVVLARVSRALGVRPSFGPAVPLPPRRLA